MKADRREFLKLAGLAGLGLSATARSSQAADARQQPGSSSARAKRPGFNMTGYAAPRLEKVRIGTIGLGSRGSGMVGRITRIEGAEIKAVCDIIPERAQAAADRLTKAGFAAPTTYTRDENEWRKVCERDDIDLIYICTPWKLHTPIAVYAMNHGKHAVMEVPAALTIEECWQLVDTSEATRRHCMMASNVCYDFFETLTLSMARAGYFGDIIHGEGAYLHTFTFNPQNKIKTWRLSENIARNGNLYPTHGAGPVCQAMNINCGDRLDYLVSVSSADFSMRDNFAQAAKSDPFWEPFASEAQRTGHRGNINTSIIRTVKGRTLMMQHDITSPQPYSRLHKLVGTKATAMKYPEPPRIATGHNRWLNPAEFRAVEEKFTPKITRHIGDLAKKVGGHGGIDFMMDWRLIDCLRNGLPLDMSVYDAVTWSVIAPLSEWSVANRSMPIDVPDFTSGRWQTNPPGMDLQLSNGGTTRAS